MEPNARINLMDSMCNQTIQIGMSEKDLDPRRLKVKRPFLSFALSL